MPRGKRPLDSACAERSRGARGDFSFGIWDLIFPPSQIFNLLLWTRWEFLVVEELPKREVATWIASSFVESDQRGPSPENSKRPDLLGQIGFHFGICHLGFPCSRKAPGKGALHYRAVVPPGLEPGTP